MVKYRALQSVLSRTPTTLYQVQRILYYLGIPSSSHFIPITSQFFHFIFLFPLFDCILICFAYLATLTVPSPCNNLNFVLTTSGSSKLNFAQLVVGKYPNVKPTFENLGYDLRLHLSFLPCITLTLVIYRRLSLFLCNPVQPKPEFNRSRII